MFASGSDDSVVHDVFAQARRDPARAVLEGFHAVKHAVRFGAELEVLAVHDRAAVVRLAERLAPDVAPVVARVGVDVDGATFARLSPVAVRTGIVAIARRPQPAALRDGRPAVVLEAPRDLGNVGACVRVAAAAGAAGVVVTGERDPWAPEAVRGSAGLHFALPVLRGDPPAGRPLVALDPDGDPFDPRAVAADAALTFGTERDGLTDAVKRRADAVLALPMEPGVSSLNLATSVAAALYAIRLA